MTNEKLLQLIQLGIDEIKDSGENGFGKIELIIRDGEVKHLNVSYEMNLPAKKRYFHPTIPSEKSQNQL